MVKVGNTICESSVNHVEEKLGRIDNLFSLSCQRGKSSLLTSVILRSQIAAHFTTLFTNIVEGSATIYIYLQVWIAAHVIDMILSKTANKCYSHLQIEKIWYIAENSQLNIYEIIRAMLLLHKFTVIDFESISKGSQNSFTFMISYKSCSYVKFILDVLPCVAQHQKNCKNGQVPIYVKLFCTRYKCRKYQNTASSEQGNLITTTYWNHWVQLQGSL